MFSFFKFRLKKPYQIPEDEPEVTVYKRDFKIIRRKIDEHPGVRYFIHSKLRKFCIYTNTLQQAKDDVDLFLGLNGMYEEYRHL